uniref:uncharacterized protein LOC122597536 n=1 Tax=Erigeron canadensis TaxID=72917 RepID=UPI001CB9B357|nr:uncharacterized protein LOC122597536 [Erigeron canadensis]
MDSSAIARYIPQISKKRVFPGSSSSGGGNMEPDVIEIAPPSANSISKRKAKGKQVAYLEIIDVDMDEDRNDVVFIERMTGSNKKTLTNSAKKVKLSKNGKGVPVEHGHSSKSFTPGSNNFFDLDDYIFDDDYSALQAHFDDINFPTGIEASVPSLPDLLQMKKKIPVNALETFHAQLAASQSQHTAVNPSSTSTWFPSSEQNPGGLGRSTYLNSMTPNNFNVVQAQNNPYSYTGVGSRYYPRVGNGASSFSTVYPLGLDTEISKWHNSVMKNHLGLNDAFSDAMFPESGGISIDNMLAGQNTGNVPTPISTSKPNATSSSLVGSSSSMATLDKDDALKRYESFKKFDTVVDYSDHAYAIQKPGVKQPPKNWAKKIQEEWRILEKDLPDTIFVRVYESRMDILRAVIVGAEGTPYHDGLFFFDVCFPSSYPNIPPLVYYRSGGLRINPNLYGCGKVCLSLLNTWTGGPKEKWLPGTSTMLQVLVSIQGLILNTKPYFNEPGFAHSNGSVRGENASVKYNEETLIKSLKTMVYTMRQPPKNFEDLVVGHFRARARDILMACKAYTEGVQVGCLVRGGVQDVDEGDNSCSTDFKNSVVLYIKNLIAAFKDIGANEAEEFLSISKKQSSLPASAPNPTLSLGHTPFQFMSPVSAFNQHCYKSIAYTIRFSFCQRKNYFFNKKNPRKIRVLIYMDSSTFSTYTHNSKKRLFLESNSSSSWELDVIKSEPESSDQISISKEADFEEMINVDMDEDLVEDKIASTKKMKGSTDMSLSPRSALHSNLEATVDSAKEIETIDKGKGILVEPDLSEESLTPESNELFDLDGYVSDDDFWALQAHFDNIDLPAGVEAPFPLLPDIVQMKKKTPVHQQNGIDQLSTSTRSPNYTGGPTSGWQYDPKITVKSEKKVNNNGSKCQQNGVDQLSTSTWSPNYTGDPSSGSRYDPNITVKSEKKEVPMKPGTLGSNNSFDIADYVDEDLWALQAHFDNIDLPTGIEAPIPWLPDFVQMKKTTPVEPLVTKHALFAASKSQPNGDESTFNFSNKKKLTVRRRSTFFDVKSQSNLTHVPAHNLASNYTGFGTNLYNNPYAQAHKGTSQTPFAASQSQLHGVNPLPSSIWHQSSEKNSAVWKKSSFFDVKPPSDVQSYIADNIPSHYTGSGSGFYYNPNTQAGNGRLSFSSSYHPPASDPKVSEWQNSIMKNHMELNEGSLSAMFPEHGGMYPEYDTIPDFDTGDGLNLNPNANPNLESSISSLIGSSSSMARLDNDEVKKMYESFKNFDIVVDFPDHTFASMNQAMMQPTKNWTKKIQEEWRILKKDLPDTIFVRAYESRMDLLRAVIIGAEGTPYHDGLFVFDVCFPRNYPNTPPLVNYRSSGLRINPNLYGCGKVCLSLLNTWAGGPQEKWRPGYSTMLQVLVSIQGLILNSEPYFNEPGHEYLRGSPRGENRSMEYNENTLILSLKTMVYTMNRPPKDFEYLVVGHFRNHVRDILSACKAYTEDVRVGCFVKGGVTSVVDKVDDRSNSANFKNDVVSYIKTLISAFKNIGAQEADEFLSISDTKVPLPASAPVRARRYGYYPFQFTPA